jgi:hypothetical protein
MVVQSPNSNMEFEIAWDNSTASELLSLIQQDNSLSIFSDGYYWANPNVIFTLKKSHRYLKDSPHFIKTMNDYQHMKNLGCQIPDSLQDWYRKREKETYWYQHPKLDVTKDKFFNGDNIPYIFDHDDIHKAIKHLDMPAYEYYKSNDKEVFCSKKLFMGCNEEIKLYGVLEESYVLALERSQIPLPGKWSPRKSFEYALEKVSTSITSGWFREYAYDNYYKVLNLYNDNYVSNFWKAVDDGKVKRININESSR